MASEPELWYLSVGQGAEGPLPWLGVVARVQAVAAERSAHVCPVGGTAWQPFATV
ncbi:MAG: hypothetical protein HC897_10285, partial [Thermoanaerobaculia bacterium]|nr:hypothetical protein [Thermoanaerobaculia bacterium]